MSDFSAVGAMDSKICPGRPVWRMGSRRSWQVIVIGRPNAEMVLDVMGKLWVWVRSPVELGAVIKKTIDYSAAPKRSTQGDLPRDPLHFKILARADMRELRVAYQKTDNAYPLRRGNWYEAHAD